MATAEIRQRNGRRRRRAHTKKKQKCVYIKFRSCLRIILFALSFHVSRIVKRDASAFIFFYGDSERVNVEISNFEAMRAYHRLFSSIFFAILSDPIVGIKREEEKAQNHSPHISRIEIMKKSRFNSIQSLKVLVSFPP